MLVESTRSVALEEDSDDRKPVRVVSAQVSVGQRIKEIWRSRELLLFLVRKELKVKYKNSVLGFLWSLLNPALTLIVYYVVFQLVLKNGIPYFAVFLFAGLLVWNFFQTSVMGATGAVVANGGIVKKVAFPREVLALASVGSALVFFGLQLLVLVVALAGFRYSPVYSLLPLVLLGLVVIMVFASALSIFLSAVNVFLRDVQHLVEVLLMVWFWGTPIVYPYQEIASKLVNHHLTWLLWIYLADPLTSVVLAFQRSIYGKISPKGLGNQVIHILPTAGPLWYVAVLGATLAVSCLLFIGALVVFGRIEGNFAEEL
ncbi:MAG: ABC transporter permease [Actinobacteria bacterium]|nr:ABC transporter permease [Actinomycetota bacterium]MCL6096041.1 ABC transporter permease [Actinomycetota bacterium]